MQLGFAIAQLQPNIVQEVHTIRGLVLRQETRVSQNRILQYVIVPLV